MSSTAFIHFSLKDFTPPFITAHPPSAPSPCPFKHSLKTAVQSAVHFPGQTQGTAVWMQENLMADRMTIDKIEDRFPPPPLPPSFIPFPIAS